MALIEKANGWAAPACMWAAFPPRRCCSTPRFWDHLKHAAEFGIDGIGTPTLDWAAVLKRKNAIITKHTKGLDFLMKKHKITVLLAMDG